jgi:hypothetical protein
MTKPKNAQRGPGNPAGLAPTPAKVREMKRKGYESAEALARKHGVSLSTIYMWGRSGRLPAVGTKAVSVKRWGNRWFLSASVALKAGES